LPSPLTGTAQRPGYRRPRRQQQVLTASESHRPFGLGNDVTSARRAPAASAADGAGRPAWRPGAGPRPAHRGRADGPGGI